MGNSYSLKRNLDKYSFLSIRWYIMDTNFNFILHDYLKSFYNISISSHLTSAVLKNSPLFWSLPTPWFLASPSSAKNLLQKNKKKISERNFLTMWKHIYIIIWPYSVPVTLCWNTSVTVYWVSCQKSNFPWLTFPLSDQASV